MPEAQTSTQEPVETEEEAPAPLFDIAQAEIPRFATLQAERATVFTRRQDYHSFQSKVRALSDEGEEGRRKGLGLWMLGELEAAAEHLAAFEDDSVAAFTRANAFMSLGRPAEALPIFERLAQAYPDEPKPLGGKLDAQLERDLLERGEEAAAADLRKVLDQAPESLLESAEGRYVQGRAAELAGEVEEALDHFVAAREADGSYRRNLFRLAYLAERSGLDELALDCYETLARMVPIDRNVLVNLGILYEDLGRDEDAATCYDTIIKTIPTDRRARLFLEDAKAGMEMYYDEERERKEDTLNRVLRIPITDFELSVRSRNSLSKMEVMTLGDLCRKTEAELLAFKNFGETSLNEIKEILGRNGLRLGMDRAEAAASVAKLRTSEPSTDQADVKNKSITDLKLSIRVRRTVENLGALTLGDICQHTESELLGMPNFGATSLLELKGKLAECGLTLKSD